MNKNKAHLNSLDSTSTCNQSYYKTWYNMNESNHFSINIAVVNAFGI